MVKKIKKINFLGVVIISDKTEASGVKIKRGRPKKKAPELPNFKTERDVRNYLLKTGLELSLELKNIAMKKNNIKRPDVSNAKNQQYKTALASLKTINEILKDKQLDKLEEKLELMENGITERMLEKTSSDMKENISSEALEEISKLNEELANLKA